MSSLRPWQSVNLIGDVVTVEVVAANLTNFPNFVRCILREKVGLKQGFLKVRVVGGVHATSLETLCGFLHQYLSEAKVTKKPADIPIEKQLFFYGSPLEDLYGYQSSECTPSQLNAFVRKVSKPSTFISSTSKCCADALAVSAHAFEDHYWQVISQNSVQSETLGRQLTEPEVDALLSVGADNRAKYSIDVDEIQSEDVQVCVQSKKKRSKLHKKKDVLYCPGIRVENTSFPICETFSLSSLGTILDLHSKPIPGITSPYVYIGREHASFPWHIEDGALFSINVIHYGAPCVWFIAPPDQYSQFAAVSNFLPLVPGHTSCSAVLLHKYLAASRRFLSRFGIKVHMVIQEEGEVIITYPFAAHSGVKMGHNISEAVNFGDPWWVELGMSLPVCQCLATSFQLDLKEMIAVAKPHLLSMYLRKDTASLLKALCFNDYLKSLHLLPTVPAVELQEEETQPSSPNHQVDEANELTIPVQELVVQFKGSRYALACPAHGCPQVYEGGRSKRQRMVDHIISAHKPFCADLVKQFDVANPPRVVSSRHTICPVCNEKRAGNKSHLRKHVQKMHKEVAKSLVM